MSAPPTIGSRRELAHRSSDGIDVHLLWNPATDSLVVDVRELSGQAFRLAAAPDKAFDVFNHPFAHAHLPTPPRPMERTGEVVDDEPPRFDTTLDDGRGF